MSGACSAVIAEMTPDVESDQRNQRHHDDDVQVVEDWTQLGEIAPDQRPDIRQEQTPGEQAEKGIDAELDQRHAGDTGGQRNVGTENWQEAREEGGCASICLEERIGFIGIVLGDEDIATILEHERSPSLVANTIRGHRADHTSKGAGKSYQNYTQKGVDPA